MLKAQGLCKSFESHQVLFDINLTINPGELISISGRSGSGKSTLLYIISMLDKADKGTILIDNQNVSEMTDKDVHYFRNRKMGFVFQFHYLLPEFTALENVLMPARKAKLHIEKRSSALELLERFGLQNKINSFPRQLSGGEQQRVAIARALIMKPRYIFADEPTGNLDSVNGGIVMNILEEIAGEGDASVIYVTHDLEFAQRARHKIELIDGRISRDET